MIAVLAVTLTVAPWMRPRIEAVEVGVDDANIFFVYARNVAHGHGFVWNIGGPRVEGFSSPLWLLFMIPFFAVSSRPELWLFLSAVVLVAVSLATVLHGLTTKREESTDPCMHLVQVTLAILWMMWCFHHPLFLLWTTQTLMETGLWSALLLVATSAAVWCAHQPTRDRRPLVLWVLIPFLLLGRPEGMMWAGTLIAAVWAAQWLAGKPLRLWLRHSFGSLCVYALSLGMITVFRLLYFGYPLPNTYYAKVSPDRAYTLQTGWQYFLEFSRSHPTLPFLIGTALAVTLVFVFSALFTLARRALGASDDTLSLAPSLLAALISAVAVLTGLLVPVLVGGDHFDGFRFYQPIWPLLPLPLLWVVHYLVSQLSCGGAGRSNKQVALILSLGLFALGCWAWVPAFDEWRQVGRRRLIDEFRLAKEGRQLGEALNRIFVEHKPEVGAIAVGGLQYTYKGNVNDLMGLSNIEMAHHPGDRKGIKNHAAFSKEIFYRQQPPVVVPLALPLHARDALGLPMPADFAKYLNHRWVLEPLQGLPREPEFRRRYTPALVSRADTTARECIGAFYRNDYLESLLTNDMYVVAVF